MTVRVEFDRDFSALTLRQNDATATKPVGVTIRNQSADEILGMNTYL